MPAFQQAFTDNELNKKAQAYGAMPPFIPIEKRLFKQLSQWRENLSMKSIVITRKKNWNVSRLMA